MAAVGFSLNSTIGLGRAGVPPSIHSPLHRREVARLPSLAVCCGRYVLELYRKRPGGCSSVKTRVPGAGSLSIQPLEGSRLRLRQMRRLMGFRFAAGLRRSVDGVRAGGIALHRERIGPQRRG